AACDAGADALGFVFAESLRQVSHLDVKRIVRELPPLVTAVGVFVDETVETVRSMVQECSLDLVQLHGRETREYADTLGVRYLKSFRVRDASFVNEIETFGCRTFLLDTYSSRATGGTGTTFDWKLAVEAGKYGRVILAGGLTPENVAEALAIVHPYAVDVSSGVEAATGRKDHEKIRRFIHEVRTWDYRTNEDTSVPLADDLFLKR
ncbi:MAG: phosphoribosylanthranilate isomerase, partial [Candidatus Zixiibacteriota bacterium]